ncbi:MAG: bifunctional purine biosynthesis protein PurH [Fimbriimonadales bacterium]|nr:MAG: bifunctional purine biosynthesis protein PurH [Fimbriimonadales bacterium]
MKPFALLSVTDKSGLLDFARGLVRRGYEILSTGGTGKFLADNDVDYTGVSYYTGMPEILGGRVKTLHPKVHGGILARHESPEDQAVLEELNIRPIRIVAVNLYPFEQTVLAGASREEIIENIDIGGPAMIRAAAKNAETVLVVVDPNDYDDVLQFLDGGLGPEFREKLRAKAFAHTAYYDSLIAQFFSGGDPFAYDTVTVGYRKNAQLRYGENPHQRACLLQSPFDRTGVAHAEPLWGKELSYNNLLDADAAWNLVCDMKALRPSLRACAIIKHSNPCGAAWCASLADAYQAAREADPISAFGGIVALSDPVDEGAAAAMTAQGNFLEVVLAPDWSEGALKVFQDRSGWGQSVRLLRARPPAEERPPSLRSIGGGALLQTEDANDPLEWTVVTERQPTEEEREAMRSAWVLVKHVRSNAIVLADSSRLWGVGAGQMNRVQSVRLAIEQAGDRAAACALASDAFLPFPDSIETAAQAGIRAVIQPGGSKKDMEVIAAANAHSIAMVFTGVRHFRH